MIKSSNYDQEFLDALDELEQLSLQESKSVIDHSKTKDLFKVTYLTNFYS